MLVFNACDIISYISFSSFIDEQSLFFQNCKHQIFVKYNFLDRVKWNNDCIQYQAFRNEYNQLIRDLLKKVINKYRTYLPEKVLITVFGSFAKKTERLFSDVDFTICYDIPKTSKLECVEELIDYSITKILGFSIDHAHGNFQHYPPVSSLDHITENDNHYRLLFLDRVVDYKCGPETIQENMMNIKNVRDYESLLANYKNKYENNLNIESMYSFEIIENTTEHDFFKDMSVLEKEHNIVSNYRFCLEKSILQNDVVSISWLKKELKNCIVELYIFFAKMRWSLNTENFYSMNIEMFWSNQNFISCLGESFVKKMRNIYLTFIFYWNKTEYALNKKNIPLSTRCYKKFLLEDFNSILFECWGDALTLQMLLDAKNDLSDAIEIGLKKYDNKKD